MNGFLAALRFLTILPIPGTWGTSEDDLSASPAFFPIVGIVIGLPAAALAVALTNVLPPLPVAALLTIFLAGVSQALHLDGLSDTADGFLSSRPRERVLEIMRDSHVGAMGVIAICSVLLLKVTLLASVPPGQLWRAAVLMPVAGRCAILMHMALLPYARQGGLAAIFYRRSRTGEGAWAVAALGIVGFFAAGWAGLAAAGATVAVVAAFSWYSYRRIGGATGDTLGSSCEIAEILPALALAGWHYSA